MPIRKCVCLLVWSAAAALCADTGSISGKIVTAAGKGVPVPNAPVEAKNLDTKAAHKTTSGSDGSYELSGLPAGTYEISIGRVFLFLPFHRSGVRVAGGEVTRLDIRLEDLNLGTLGDSGVEFVQVLGDKLAPTGPAPRASNGKPDLSGVWDAVLPTPLGEEPEPLPSSQANDLQRRGPSACLPGGISLAYFDEYRIVQTPTLIVILDGGFNPDRQIYLDGRGHPKDFNPSWMGHSIGHWEGDTLMVDTVGFNDLGSISVPGASGSRPQFPQTETLHVVEQFRRLDLGHLEVVRTFDDPSAFKRPFTTREVHSLAQKDVEVLEYVCNENEKDAAHRHF